MNAIQKLTLTNIRQNKKRTVATILGILLSTALICAVAGMVSSGVESLKNYLRAHDGDYHVWFDNVPAEQVSLITEDEHTARSYIVENIGYAPLADGLNPYKPYYHLIGMTPEGMTHLGLTLAKGRLPESENEIVISDHISYDAGNGLQIGDSITLEVGTRVGSDGQTLTQLDPYEIETDENGAPLYPEESITDTVSRTFEVVGITERPIRPIENYSSPGYTLITLADEHPEGTLSVAVTYHNAKQFVTCTQQILENLSSAGLDNVEASDNKDLLEMEGALAQRTLGVLYTLAAIILLIILATSVFVIRNSFVISVSEKTRQYGMLSSLGATSRQLRRSVLFEGLVLGLIGIPLGILLGVAAVLILIRILNLLLGNIMAGMHFVYSIPPATFLLTIALGAVTILLSSLLPAIRAGRTSPIEAIRGAEQVNLSGRRLRVSPLYKKWFGMGGVIAAKNLKRSRRKYRTTVISLILSTSVFIALSSFTSMGRQAAGMIYSDHGYNIAVSTQGNPAMHEAYDTILKQIEAKKAAYYYTTGADMDVRYLSDEYPNRYEGQESEYVQVFLLEPDAFSALAQEAGVQADDGLLLYNRLLTYAPEGGKKLLDAFSLTAGDTLDLSFLLNDGQQSVIPVRISGLLEEMPFGLNNMTNGACLIGSMDAFNKEILEDSFLSSLFIDAQDPDQVENEIRTLASDHTEWTLSIYNVQQEVRDTRRMILVIEIFLYGFIIVITLIGVTNVFNTISTNMMLRRKEFAIYRSIGMTDPQFRSMIRLENIFYSLKSLIFGIPIGVAGSYLLYRVMANEMDLGYHFPVVSILIAVLFVFVIVTWTMSYSLKKTHTDSITDAIRDDTY